MLGLTPRRSSLGRNEWGILTLTQADERKKAWILGGSVNTVCVKKDNSPIEIPKIDDEEMPM